MCHTCGSGSGPLNGFNPHGPPAQDQLTDQYGTSQMSHPLPCAWAALLGNPLLSLLTSSSISQEETAWTLGTQIMDVSLTLAVSHRNIPDRNNSYFDHQQLDLRRIQRWLLKEDAPNLLVLAYLECLSPEGSERILHFCPLASSLRRIHPSTRSLSAPDPTEQGSGLFSPSLTGGGEAQSHCRGLCQ